MHIMPYTPLSPEDLAKSLELIYIDPKTIPTASLTRTALDGLKESFTAFAGNIAFLGADHLVYDLHDDRAQDNPRTVISFIQDEIDSMPYDSHTIINIPKAQSLLSKTYGFMNRAKLKEKFKTVDEKTSSQQFCYNAEALITTISEVEDLKAVLQHVTDDMTNIKAMSQQIVDAKTKMKTMITRTTGETISQADFHTRQEAGFAMAIEIGGMIDAYQTTINAAQTYFFNDAKNLVDAYKASHQTEDTSNSFATGYLDAAQKAALGLKTTPLDDLIQRRNTIKEQNQQLSDSIIVLGEAATPLSEKLLDLECEAAKRKADIVMTSVQTKIASAKAKTHSKSAPTAKDDATAAAKKLEAEKQEAQQKLDTIQKSIDAADKINAELEASIEAIDEQITQLNAGHDEARSAYDTSLKVYKAKVDDFSSKHALALADLDKNLADVIEAAKLAASQKQAAEEARYSGEMITLFTSHMSNTSTIAATDSDSHATTLAGHIATQTTAMSAITATHNQALTDIDTTLAQQVQRLQDDNNIEKTTETGQFNAAVKNEQQDSHEKLNALNEAEAKLGKTPTKWTLDDHASNIGDVLDQITHAVDDISVPPAPAPVDAEVTLGGVEAYA